MPSELISPESLAARAHHGLPPELVKSSHAAWSRFCQLPLPKRTDEAWRFADTSAVHVDGFALAPPVTPAEASAIVANEIPKFSADAAASIHVFANGRLVHAQPPAADPRHGNLFCGTIGDATKANPELAARYLFNAETAPLGGDKFLALHQAWLAPDGGFVLLVPDGCTVPGTVVVVHHLSGHNAAVFPHTLVVAGKNSNVNIAEFFVCSDNPTDAQNLAVPVCDIHADAGAKITRVAAQNWGRNVRAHHLDTVHAAAGSTVTSVALNLGGRRARSESVVNLNGADANAQLYALTIADAAQEFDQRTLQVHNAGGARSDLLCKNALFDNAHTIFSGLIRVEPDAQKTDAYQTNRNLLLSPTARADSLPGLLIEANDVKCSHGATNSQVDRDEMFYLRARGIPEQVAQELVVFGFFEEIIGKVDDAGVAEALRELVRTKLGQRTAAKNP